MTITHISSFFRGQATPILLIASLGSPFSCSTELLLILQNPSLSILITSFIFLFFHLLFPTVSYLILFKLPLCVKNIYLQCFLLTSWFFSLSIIYLFPVLLNEDLSLSLLSAPLTPRIINSYLLVLLSFQHNFN